MAAGVETIVDVDRETGLFIQGWERCKQSIITILTTRLNTRLMRLWWGSAFLDAQDRPGNEEVIMRSIFAAIVSINKYEPEFKINRVTIDEFGPDGAITITVTGTYLPEATARRVTTTL
jgi:phage baseplate assembly protein W